MSVRRRDNWLKVSVNSTASISAHLGLTFNISASAAMTEMFFSSEDATLLFALLFMHVVMLKTVQRWG